MKSKSFLILILLFSFTFINSCKKKDEPEPDPTPTPVENLNPGPCDNNLLITETDVLNYALALDICKVAASTSDWGLISANFIRGNANIISVNNQFGILANFGNNNSPNRGTRMIALSSGAARSASQPGACGSSACSGTGTGTAPNGFPAPIAGCPVSMVINDDVGIKLVLRVPASATGFSIDHNFFTFDFPTWTCTSFNDQFIILVDPAVSGSSSLNVALDSSGRPIGVNCQFMNSANSSLLTGTGFDSWGSAGATGWLRTTVPVTGGSTITISMIIYDVGDDALDSTVLLDNFQWLKGSVTMETKKI